jgi:Astacin (Peptidase family M12A)
MAADPHCSTPPPVPPPLSTPMALDRQHAIIVGASKWVNGTVLRYAFFDAAAKSAWAAGEAQKDVVRKSFQVWKDLPLGLDFKEVDDLGEAEVRIGFDQNDGSWSYIGRDVLGVGVNERTMNFEWDLTTPYGHTTALHEIGHTLGMPHEHQSPFSGIVWNEEAVYTYFSGPPNNWSRAMIRSNVLDKLDPAQVAGSKWDDKSIMEYAFGEGLIAQPAAYQQGIDPPGTISELDLQWMQSWYPGDQAAPQTLDAFVSVPLTPAPKQQADFVISPPSTRVYEVGTFGSGDTVAVLFENVDGQLRQLAGDDDSGEERNARLNLKLFQGREYILRVRLNWAGQSGKTAVMYW